MKICFISSAHTKFDKRVFEKQAVSLAKAGFEVSHLAPDELQSEESVQGVSVYTYPKRAGLRGRIINLVGLYKYASGIDADAYHANEVDSWLVAMCLKFTRKKRVVFDVHEFYPSMFGETRFPKPLQWLGSGFIKSLYRFLAPKSDAIVFANRYIESDFQGISGNYIMVENFGMLQTVEKLKSLSADNSRNVSDDFTLMHVGLFAQERGSDVILEAASLANDSRLKMELVGKIVDEEVDKYRARIEAQNLGNCISAVEWLEFDQMLEKLSVAHAGFVFFQSGSQTNAVGLPHKLFDYMAAGLPVLVSNHSRYVAEIVKDADCGWIIDSENPEEISKTLKMMMDSPELVKQKGSNGRTALIERYNWQTEIDRLADFYQKLEA